MRSGIRLVVLAVIAAACNPGNVPRSGTVQRPIVGGTADTGHPAVGAVVGTLNGGSTLCAGTLITPKIVLTSAQCLTLGAGEQVLWITGDNIDSGVQHAVAAFEADSAFKVGTDGNPVHDLGVVVLATPPDGLSPVAWRTASMTGTEGQSITFVGSGATTANDSNTTGVKHSMTTVVGKVGTEGIWNYVTGTPVQSPCGGDSGGPGLMTVDGVEQVAALVSSGDQACAVEGWNIRVDANAEWLASMIAKYDPPATGDGTDAGEGAVSEGAVEEAVAPEEAQAEAVAAEGVAEEGVAAEGVAAELATVDAAGGDSAVTTPEGEGGSSGGGCNGAGAPGNPAGVLLTLLGLVALRVRRVDAFRSARR